jgi:hypothetical protein
VRWLRGHEVVSGLKPSSGSASTIVPGALAFAAQCGPQEISRAEERRRRVSQKLE